MSQEQESEKNLPGCERGDEDRDSLDLPGVCRETDELHTNSSLPAFWDICAGLSLSTSTACQEAHWTKDEGSDNSQVHTLSVILKCLSLTEMFNLWNTLLPSLRHLRQLWHISYWLILFYFTFLTIKALVYYIVVLGILLWFLCHHLHLIRTSTSSAFH